jgi:pilus assembly protein FimV
MDGEELAPALAAMDEESLFSATTLNRAPTVSSVTEEIVDTIDGLFLDHDEIPAAPGFGKHLDEPITETKNVEIQGQGEELIGFEDWLKEDSKDEGSLEVAVGSEGIQADDKKSFSNDEQEPELVTAEGEAEDELTANDFVENQEEDNLTSFFTANDLEQSAKDGSEIDALFDSLEVDIVEETGGDTPAEVSDNLESFFGSKEEQEELHEEVISGALPENREEDVETSVNALFTETHLVEDDAVVFELFKEEDDANDVVRQESENESELPLPGTLIVPDDSHVTGFAGPTGNEIVEELAESIAVAERIMPESLDELQACIDSLKIEVNDAIIAGLFKEINALRQKWADKPLEKTFLQLLSTVTQHIDRYRYESSAEAYGLLVTICQAISNLKDDDSHGSQEVLLSETCKVLEWQQGMLFRQAVKKGNQLTFADPLRTEKEGAYQADAQKDFDDLLGSYEDDGADEIDVKNELLVEGRAEHMQETFAADLKKEIAALRQTLQMEIAELRREIKKE